MWKFRKLGLRPFHNSKGVEEIDFDGTTFKISFVAWSVYPQKDNGNEE